MPAFESSVLNAGESAIYIERGGSGPPVLLLHGFPETLVMWRDVAPLLAHRFSVVCADLRGPEEQPQETARALTAFFASARD